MKSSNTAKKQQEAPSKVVNIGDAAAFKKLNTLHEGVASTYGLKRQMALDLLAGTITGVQLRQWEIAKVKDAGENEAAKVSIRNTIRQVQEAIRKATDTRKASDGGKVTMKLTKDKAAYAFSKVGHVRGNQGKKGKKGGKATEEATPTPEAIAEAMTPKVVAEWCLHYLNDKETTQAQIMAFREMFLPVAVKLGIVGK